MAYGYLNEITPVKGLSFDLILETLVNVCTISFVVLAITLIVFLIILVVLAMVDFINEFRNRR